MKKTRKLSDITAELIYLADQISLLKSSINIITGKLGTIDRDMETLESVSADSGNSAKIIPFPGSFNNAATDKLFDPRRKEFTSSPVQAAPGKPLPTGFFDYRPHLQRDGLILLAWDMRTTEMGELYTAYWVTSTGITRYYASKPLPSGDFTFARPNHKSYAAEDGIEFYGQEAPDYLVHVAPELMMSNPRHVEQRQIHVEKLKLQGSKVDFNYKFLLKTEKNRNLPLIKSSTEGQHRAG